MEARPWEHYGVKSRKEAVNHNTSSLTVCHGHSGQRSNISFNLCVGLAPLFNKAKGPLLCLHSTHVELLNRHALLFKLTALATLFFLMSSFTSNYPFSVPPSFYSLIICLTIVIAVYTEMTTSLHSSTSWFITECLGRNLLRNHLWRCINALSFTAHHPIIPSSLPLSLCPSAFSAHFLKLVLWNSSSIPQPPTP